MGYGFIKTNINTMKFDCIKDREKIIFNHYIMRKENLNRIQKDLPIGQFMMTVSSVSIDLNISKTKAQRLIKDFEDKKIIKAIAKGTLKNKDSSVYQYVTSDTDDDITNDTEFPSNIKVCRVTNDNNVDTDNDNSKKENINKKLNNKELYIRIIDYLNRTTGKSFKPTTPKTLTRIEARIKEGFVEEGFYKVIDIKSKQWLHSEMNKFLRPETLFSNKFEGYLNENTEIFKDDDEIEEWNIEFEY